MTVAVGIERLSRIDFPYSEVRVSIFRAA
jgi:hypothetical protein